MKRELSGKVALVGLALIMLLSGCATTSTEITASWLAPETADKTFDRILVLLVTDNLSSRRIGEQAIASRLQQEKVDAIVGLELIPPEPVERLREMRESLATALRAEGVEAVLLVSLLDVQDERRYVPGSVRYDPVMWPSHYYGGFYNYWYVTYDRVQTPGYYEESRNIFLLSNLYDLSTGELAWSAQSESRDPQSKSKLAGEVASKLVRQMKRDGVLP
jgi:hypothetical protein